MCIRPRLYFLVYACLLHHLFPTDITVRPSTLRFLNCSAPFGSMMEATSAVMGVSKGYARV